MLHSLVSGKRLRDKIVWGVLLTVFLTGAAIVQAGTTGKISGVVTDGVTGRPIAGAIVTVVGTDLQARTDADGRYVILNVPVGSHTLEATVIGEDSNPAETELLLFQQIEVQELKVSVDLNTEQDITLTSTPVDMGTIVVIAERPLLIKDRTASMRVVEREQIQELPVRGYRDLVALQPGVVQRVGNLLNIRGGRFSEVAYFVDGFSQQDPLTGISTTEINQDDLEEIAITTGGFNAEYGWIASGAINVTTKEGGDHLAGTFEAVTDNFHANSYDYNVYDASISGPIPGSGDRGRFIVSSERRWEGDQQPSAITSGPLERNTSGGWTVRSKLNYKLSKSVELKLGGLSSVDKWDYWLSEWQFNPTHAPRLEDQNYSLYTTFEHVISPRTFYTISGNYFYTERERGDGLHFDDIWGYGRPGTRASFDQTNLFWAWEDLYGPTEIEDTVIDGHVYPIRGDEAATWNDYLHRQSSYVGFDFDVVSQIHPQHEVRGGIDFQRHTLRRYQHLDPRQVYLGYEGDATGFDAVDRYGFDITGENKLDSGLDGAKHPITFAAFLQDKFELDGMIINAGLRFDYLNVNTKRLRDETSPLDPDHFLELPHPTEEQRELANKLDPGDLEDSQAEVEISPRVGIAFPVSEHTVFHASYGRFMQRPDLMRLYVSYDFLEYMVQNQPFFFPFGNPNLRPERTNAYEVGFTRQLGYNSKFGLTAFYKDVDGLTQIVHQSAKPNSFSTYRNVDFGTIKGVELSFELRRSNNVSFDAAYSLSNATGTGSTPISDATVAWQGLEAPRVPTPLDHDQRHKFTATLDVRARDKEGPTIGDWHVLENAGVNVTAQLGSGFPYTPTEVEEILGLNSTGAPVDGAINSRYGPWTMQFDLKATKAFRWGGGQLEFQLWVINLFNRTNALFVHSTTGLPYTTGWLETPEGQDWLANNQGIQDSSNLTAEQKYLLRENDPSNYGPPRQIRAGVKFSF
jgi:outer membrane receptor protein involved in Fe transport